MKNDSYLSAMAGIDEDLISRSERPGGSGSLHSLRVKRAIAAVCVCVIAVGVFVTAGILKKPGSVDTNKYTVVSPVIPAQLKINSVPWDDFDNQWSERYTNSSEARKEVDFIRYHTLLAGELLSEENGQNKVCSPMNLYVALSMLSSCTDGQSRRQILDVLGVKTEKEAREAAMKLIRGNYVDDGTQKSLPANSIWTGKTVALNESFLREFSDNYYAPVFSGDASDKAYSEAFRSWLNTATGGQLKDSVRDVEFDPRMALTLASTLYFSAKWGDEFEPKENTDGVFHGANGDSSATFMNQKYLGTCYRGKNFIATSKSLDSRSSMWFILPDEGTSPESIVDSEELAGLLYRPNYAEMSSNMVYLSLPKFDVSSDYRLKDSLNKLGINDVFNFELADFSPITNEKLFVSDFRHSATVTADEKGVVGAAYTTIELYGAGMPEKDVYFTLDRPFIFAIKGDTGDVIFLGIVNTVS